MIRLFLISTILLFVSSNLWAIEQEAVVINVRKKVKLHNTERIYSDYFIRGGSKLGLSPGVLVSVVRRIPVHDPFENSSIGDFRIKVADIEIIQVDADKSIGRLIEIDRREARPMLTYDAVMIGDRLDLDTMRAKVAYKRVPESVFENPDRVPAAAKVVKPSQAKAQIPEAIEPEIKLPEPTQANPLQ